MRIRKGVTFIGSDLGWSHTCAHTAIAQRRACIKMEPTVKKAGEAQSRSKRPQATSLVAGSLGVGFRSNLPRLQRNLRAASRRKQPISTIGMGKKMDRHFFYRRRSDAAPAKPNDLPSRLRQLNFQLHQCSLADAVWTATILVRWGRRFGV